MIFLGHIPQLAWADMLNMLDNESFQVAVPKTDGAVDNEWNRSGKEAKRTCVFTSNDPIVYVSGNVVNKLETSAWNERFGTMLHFQVTLTNQIQPSSSFPNAHAVILIGFFTPPFQLPHARPTVDLLCVKKNELTWIALTVPSPDHCWL